MPTFTIEVTAQQANRIVTAFGKAWKLKDAGGNPRNATQAEIRKYMIDCVHGVVSGTEKQEAINAVSDPSPLGVS